jgi:cardiolipin synthase
MIGHLPDFDLADQAFQRIAGAGAVSGNRVRLLRDAAENYPAWMKAIGAAERWIIFESYLFWNDDVGRQFADLLCEKARSGVRVRLVYDWMGTLWRGTKALFRRLEESGVEVRPFNPPIFDSPLSWLSRDHRKMVSVDGRIAFVGGLCVGQQWSGYPDRNSPPWRDTGMEIEGPAVLEVDKAFAANWRLLGTPLDPRETALPRRVAGDVMLRVVPSIPSAGSIYHLDHLISTLAEESIWIADAYFAGTSSYVHALCSAAESGVDVRMLIPGAMDVPIVRSISRAGLRPLLESGVRVFEWNGSMMHAKTAVVDGSWARIGSTNLNLSSWIGNWELDVVVENEAFAREMEAMYLEDLSRSTEIVLAHGWRKKVAARRPGTARRPKPLAGGSASRTAAGMMRLSRTVGAAVTRSRELGPAEAVIMLWSAALLLAVSAILMVWPRLLAIPLAILCLWFAVSFVSHGLRLRAKGKIE